MGFFDALAAGFRRDAQMYEKGAKLAETAAEAEARFQRGDCLRCGLAKATVSVDGKVILCSPCAEAGAAGLGEFARHVAEDGGLVKADKASPVGAFLKGFLGERRR